MFKAQSALIIEALLAATSVAAQAQAMSKKTSDNPTTNGYATPGAAMKDQNSA
jgi:hypothetical protein